MENNSANSGNGESGGKNENTSSETLAILQRYSRGDISDWAAAELLGEDFSQHDVFTLIRRHKLPLPLPPIEELNRQKAALEALFGTEKLKN